MIFRIIKFPNLQNATCCANCRVTAYTNRILISFYDIELTNAELKNRATRAMGLKQECPNRTAGRHCHALRFKHRMLMIILNEIPLIDPLFAPAPRNTPSTHRKTKLTDLRMLPWRRGNYHALREGMSAMARSPTRAQEKQEP